MNMHCLIATGVDAAGYRGSRRVFIAARFQASPPGQQTPEEIYVIRLAWEDMPHNDES
jgi:hypothetical protein